MSNEHEAPEVAPSHTDVRSEFPVSNLAMVVGLGAVAIGVGIVLGFVLSA